MPWTGATSIAALLGAFAIAIAAPPTCKTPSRPSSSATAAPLPSTSADRAASGAAEAIAGATSKIAATSEVRMARNLADDLP